MTVHTTTVGGVPVEQPARSGRSTRLPAALTVLAGGVGAVGVVSTGALMVADHPVQALSQHPLQLGVLAAALVLGELKAIPVPRGDSTTNDLTISTIFIVALVIAGPVSFALAVMVLAVVVDDLRSRRSRLQMLFNCGQYAISMIAARWVYCALSATPFLGGYTPFSGEHLAATLAAGAVFVVVNQTLVSTVVAVASGQTVTAVLLEDRRFKLQTSAVLVGLAPVAAVLLKESVFMLPLLVLPILTVGGAAHLAVLRERQALHDSLTGLPNRSLFRLVVERALSSPDSPGVAVLMVDLDHFKDVNDTLGHHIGDELLTVVARQILAAAEACDQETHVSRLGGDEFAILIVADRPRDRAVEFAGSLLERLSHPVEVQGSRLSVQASIGITTTDGGRLDDVFSALKQADIALYEAKHERARASVFDATTMTASVDRVRLLPQLQEAIERRQLTVLYQPQVDAPSGRVVSFEALVRWDHPTQGRLAPGTFIDVAESSGLIAPITTFVLEEALAMAARCERLGHPVGVSVNVSARQLSDLSLPDQVASLLLVAGVPAYRLTIEVTESSLMADPRAARIILRALRHMGVQLSIDDFGTGYSSLVLLQQLDVDELKVDRTFVADMASQGSDALVRSIIDLGHSIGLTVVAEGVETQDVADRLAGLRCDLLQGYLFGRPMEPCAAEELLRLAGRNHGDDHVRLDPATA